MLIAPYGTRNYRKTRNNIESEIDLSNHEVLNEKASTRVTDSCTSFLELKHSNEYRLAHGVRIRLRPFTNSSIHHLWPHHTQHHRAFIKFRKADWASFKDDVDLKLENQQMSTTRKKR